MTSPNPKAVVQAFVQAFNKADVDALVWRDPLGLRGCGFFHVVHGEIRFQRGYWDKFSFLRQHGLPLPEGSVEEVQ